MAEDQLQIKVETAPFDPRFPNTNQTKNCWQNYVDFHKCQKAKGEDYEPCTYFKKVYKSLCPTAWVSRWDSVYDLLLLSFAIIIGAELGQPVGSRKFRWEDLDAHST